jgi:hypothetical protein
VLISRLEPSSEIKRRRNDSDHKLEEIPTSIVWFLRDEPSHALRRKEREMFQMDERSASNKVLTEGSLMIRR